MLADAAQTTSDLLATPDFIAKLDAPNLAARGCRSLLEYIRRYRLAIGTFTPREESVLQEATHAVSRLVREDPELAHLRDLPLRFAKSISADAEGGMPHTVGGTVVLPQAAVQAPSVHLLPSLVLHEATHIWQRRNPDHAAAEARALGFRRTGSFRDRPGLRANPDTDQTLYSLGLRQINAALRDDATSLHQTQPQGRYSDPRFARCKNHEHPFEIVAELNALRLRFNQNDT